MLFFITGISIVFLLVIIFVNEDNRLRNLCFSLMVLSILLAQLTQYSLSLSDSMQVNYLSFFEVDRQTLADLHIWLYFISCLSLLGYLYAINKRS